MGKRVLRLKGSDPAIFGRAVEELTHPTAHGIPVKICPGITAASAAVASAGASLTIRGSARKLTFVTNLLLTWIEESPIRRSIV